MKVPAFNDTMEDKRKKRKSKTGELFKQRFRRTFVMLLEEAQQEAEAGEPSYTSAKVPPSKFPERHFCAVCGFPSNYTCVSCGSRYCCVKCLGTHQDTRCLKWTVWRLLLLILASMTFSLQLLVKNRTFKSNRRRLIRWVTIVAVNCSENTSNLPLHVPLTVYEEDLGNVPTLFLW